MIIYSLGKGEKLDECQIKTNIDGYTQNYSIDNLLISEKDFKLYNNIWLIANRKENSSKNNKLVYSPFPIELAAGIYMPYIDDAANTQYFANPESKKRIVVFGHTHVPMLKNMTTVDGQPAVYANSGSWVDGKYAGQYHNRTFVKIACNDSCYDVSVNFFNNPSDIRVLEASKIER